MRLRVVFKELETMIGVRNPQASSTKYDMVIM